MSRKKKRYRSSSKKNTGCLGCLTFLFLLMLIIGGFGSCIEGSDSDKHLKERSVNTETARPSDTERQFPAETVPIQEEPAAAIKEEGTEDTDKKETDSSETGIAANDLLPEDHALDVRFIDVGQGDASLITCDGHSMLIDGGRSRVSDKIYTILKNEGIDHLDYIVATHPEADHVGGLAGALNYATVGIAFSPVEKAENEAFNDFKKYLNKQGAFITVPEVGSEYRLGAASFKILGPVRAGDSTNNDSIVIKLTCGDNSFLFTGDAEEQEEQDILTSGENLNCAVLKVAHHGSHTSTGKNWLQAVSPEYAVISCGYKNDYGHPHEEVVKLLKDHDIKLLRTDLQGDILFHEEGGGSLTVTVSRNTSEDVYASGNISEPETEAKPASSTAPKETDYIVNTNTGKFHYPDCKSVKRMKEKNKMYFTGERQELINRGYSPCGNCHP